MDMLPIMKLPPWFNGQMGVPGSDTVEGLRVVPGAVVYYVDKNHPSASDSNDGTDPNYPLATITQARALRNARIDWAHDAYEYDWILVGPGVYAENLGGFYYTHLVGLGILGTDTATEIHPAEGSAVAGTLLGAHFTNIRFEAETAVPVLDVGIGNNSIIEDCEIVKGIAGLATVGIDFENASHMQIRRCFFVSGVANFAKGIVFNGGANKYAHACRIEDNRILAVTAGIEIAADCTASNAMIVGNVISNPAVGINDLSGDSICAGNYVTGTDAIVHANSATQCIGNHVINDGTGAMETANS